MVYRNFIGKTILVIFFLCIAFQLSYAQSTENDEDFISFGVSFKKATKDFEQNIPTFQQDFISAVSDLTGIDESLFFFQNDSITVIPSDMVLTQISVYVNDGNNNSSSSNSTSNNTVLQTLYYDDYFDILDIETPSEVNSTWQQTVTKSQLNTYPFAQKLGGVSYVGAACSTSTCSLSELSDSYGKKSAGILRYDVATICVIAAIVLIALSIIFCVLAIASASRKSAIARTQEHKRLLEQQHNANNNNSRPQQQDSAIEMA